MKKIIGYILLTPIALFLLIAVLVELIDPFVTHNVPGMVIIGIIAAGLLGMYLTY